MGKVITMSSNPQPTSSGEVLATPVAQSYFRDLSTVLEIHRSLVLLGEKVSALEVTTKSNSENLDDLNQMAYAIPYLEREFAQTKKDLNDLGGRHNKEVHELAMKLEKGLNDLGRRLGQDITNLKDGDITQLKHIASIAKGIVTIVLAAIAGGVLLEAVKRLWHE